MKENTLIQEKSLIEDVLILIEDAKVTLNGHIKFVKSQKDNS